MRSLTFRRGVGLEELLSLAYVTMADPQAEGGREDAVTELWKADLTHVGYSAGAGYRMDESAGDGISNNISEVAVKAQTMLDQHVGDSFKESSQPPPLLNAWLQLLPPGSGPVVLAVLPLGRDPAARLLIAQAALARIDSCIGQLPEMLRTGTAFEVQALLGAMAPLPPPRRAELATAAFDNPAPAVKLQAIPLVAADASTAVRTLGSSLTANSREVRVAAGQALGACSSAAEQASALILQTMERPQFAKVNKEEQSIFYRSLGKLGSNGGFQFLLDRLNQPPRKLFGRKKAIEIQLLAVHGLSEEASTRSAKALEEAQLESRRHPAAVVAACKAAAHQVRSAAARGGKTA